MNNIAEVINDVAAPPQKSWTFTLAKTQEAFVGMQFYDNRMYAKGCKPETKGVMYLFDSKGKNLFAQYSYDWNGFNFIRNEALPAGTYTFKFQPTWNAQDIKDYTVRVYTPTNVGLKAI